MHWINNQGVKSDEGFIVQVIDQHTLEYRESAGRSLLIGMEIGFTDSMKPSVIIDPKSIAEWRDGDTTALTTDEQARVRKRIEDAMHFQGMAIEFE